MGGVNTKDDAQEVMDMWERSTNASGPITPQTPVTGLTPAMSIGAIPTASPPDGAMAVSAADVSLSVGGAGTEASRTSNPVDALIESDKEHVPTVFRWEHGGERIFVTGTFNKWAEKIEMKRSGNDFTYIHKLKKGKHAYKFIVDDEWRFAPDQPTVYDPAGHVNNFIDLRDFKTHDELEADRPEQPADEPEGAVFGQEMPDMDEFAKQPSALPPHLRQIVLNTPPPPEDPRRLQVPLHVTVNHLHCTAIKDRLMVLGVTQRHRRKFVTTVYYSWLPS